MGLNNRSILGWAGLLVLVLVLLAGTAGADAGPRTVLPATAYDFGSVVEGTVVSHDFVIRNEGAEELVIEKIEAG